MSGGALLLTAGARFSLNEDQERNELLNLLAYVGLLLPAVFLIVFFLIERV